MARMPHQRVKRGKTVDLQTKAAFGNRAHRFRVPNQIPATKPKRGSYTYKEGILKNLARRGVITTEGLSVLDSDQVGEVREKNKGKFADKSRYVINNDNSPSAPPSLELSGARSDDDAIFESEDRDPGSCMGTAQSQETETQGDEDADADAYIEGTNDYDASTKTAEQYNISGQEHNSTAAPTLYEEQPVPLFATIDDQGLAMVENENWTTPEAVIMARRNGNQQTRQIGVYWYAPTVPRHVGADGNIVQSVVDLASMDSYWAQEPIPGDDQLVWQDDSAYDTVPPSAQCSTPADDDPFFDFDGYERSQDCPPQAPSFPDSTAPSTSQTPPQPAANQHGRYQTQSDSVEEVWRTQYGPSGF